MDKEMSSLEKDVMLHLLAGKNNTLSVLRQQYLSAVVKSKEYTGAGFFIYFTIPKDAPKLSSEQSFDIGDVAARIDGLQNGAGFILYINKGTIRMLEGYTFGEEIWPKSVEHYELYYTTNGKRNLPF
ncbi:MAG TPA: hypothetical protein VL197_03770 [Nitrospirota bacterium]|nr:hypothetical protein [Nitrospirota bacterium]